MLTLLSLVNFPDALLLLRINALGFGVAGVVGAYVLYNASYALLSYPAGVLADRWPKHRIYGIGLVCFAVGYLGLGLVDRAIWAVPLLLVYGGFTAATDGVGKAWISGLVPDEVQSSAQGLFQGLSGGAVLLAGVWAGLAWGGTGVVPLLISGTVAAALAAGLLTGAVPLPAAGRRDQP